MALSPHSRPTWPSFLKHPPKGILYLLDAHLQALSLSLGVMGGTEGTDVKPGVSTYIGMGPSSLSFQALQVIFHTLGLRITALDEARAEAIQAAWKSSKITRDHNPGPVSFLSPSGNVVKKPPCLFSS